MMTGRKHCLAMTKLLILPRFYLRKERAGGLFFRLQPLFADAGARSARSRSSKRSSSWRRPLMSSAHLNYIVDWLPAAQGPWLIAGHARCRRSSRLFRLGARILASATHILASLALINDDFCYLHSSAYRHISLPFGGSRLTIQDRT